MLIEIIVISYLRASHITETHEFYVGVYKGEPFVEEIKHGFISVKPLLGNVEKDFVELDQALEREFFRLIAAEKEEIHLRAYLIKKQNQQEKDSQSCALESPPWFW